MKLKCIDVFGLPYNESLTVGKMYEVKESHYASSHYLVVNDDGVKLCHYKTRFEVAKDLAADLKADLAADLAADLKATKQLVSDLKEQIAASKPKMGQRYKHDFGDIYMIVFMGVKYTLMCIEGHEAGRSYDDAFHIEIEDVFDGHSKYFDLIK